MLRAAIYARFSSDNQRDESIDAQVRLCRGHIERMGYVLVKTYADEAITGHTDDRPQFLQMIQDARAGLFDVLVVDKVDRFARDKYDSAIYKRELRKKCGVRIEYASQHIDESPEGLMMETILEGFAHYFSLNLAREVMKGLKENAHRGLFCGGRPPLGYRTVPAGSPDKNGRVPKTLELDPEVAPLIYRIFEIIDAGGGYREAQEATREGFIAVRGRPLSRNSIHDILKNERYTGTAVFDKGTKRNHRTAGKKPIKVPDAFPAIVPREMWERVQAKMQARRRNTRPMPTARARQPYLLTGYIFCGVCGGAMVGAAARGRDKKRYPYYECNKRNRNKDCDLKRIRQDTVEEIVLKEMWQGIFAPEMRPKVLAKLDIELQKQPQAITDELAYLDEQIKVTQRKVDNIVQAVEDGRGGALLTRLDQLEAHLETLRARRSELLAVQERPVTIEMIAKALDQAADDLQKRESPDKLRKLVEAFVQRVTVYNDEVEVILHFHFGNVSDKDGSA
ncbi:MAG: recombinase family protein, partial [Bacillota bacterium]